RNQKGEIHIYNFCAILKSVRLSSREKTRKIQEIKNTEREREREVKMSFDLWCSLMRTEKHFRLTSLPVFKKKLACILMLTARVSITYYYRSKSSSRHTRQLASEFVLCQSN